MTDQLWKMLTHDSANADSSAPQKLDIFRVYASMTAQIALDELRRLARIASRMTAADPLLAGSFGAQTRSGVLPTRCLFIGDTREIALAKQEEQNTFEYRFSLLARSADVVIFGQDPSTMFENYRTEYLGMGPIVPLVPAIDRRNPLRPLADRCRSDAKAFSRLVTIAKQDGGLTIAPHIGLAAAWRLAAELAEAAGVPICVASASPFLTQRVNDKLWFARLAAEVVGNDAIPPTYSAHSFASLVRRIRELARAEERVVVKVPDSAGGLGNVCLAPHEFARSSLFDIKRHITGVLHSLGWHDTFPLLIGLWEAPAVCSPSVQLWIPDETEGPPIIEGLFEQRLEGPEGIFVGSVPASLPRHWQERLAYQATQLATVFQLLGYYGRCSLDAIIVGTDFDRAALHWIECNGRWGGVSIPLTIVHRLRPPREFVVVERLGDRNQPRPFLAAVKALNGLLYKREEREEGIVILSPSEIEAGRGIQMLACAETIARARKIADRGVDVLTARDCA
jgi:pre ATP-grasp domain-containing protein